MNSVAVTFARKPRVDSVQDRTIPGPYGLIKIRIYKPSSKHNLPITMHFHGGGWTILSLDSHDEFCRNVCNMAETIVISVDYRMAPEYKFPIAIDECYTATSWAFENALHLCGNPKKIAVCGDSAGGNLSAAVALKARDLNAEFRLCAQALIYPAVDYLGSTPSKAEHKDAIMLSTGKMIWFWGNYLRTPADALDPYACPLRASEHRSLPPALILTAELDPLRDEGEEYARILEKSGNQVLHHRFPVAIHGFMNMGALLSEAKIATQKVSSFLKERFTAIEN
eukprot:TRINITY_DN10897_c0_g1_i2.p1 TRINITY_DN10897_c0_g1~~TRINITY_DN10897_c0_g1_i2.p1  ORF type:complete len:282 (-),score=64.92 TRINITY_DN10897_c0_g1_i2:142-987(-)